MKKKIIKNKKPKSMKAKNQVKEKRIMMEQLKSCATIMCDQFKGHKKTVRAGIDYNYQYVVIGAHPSVNHSFSAIVKHEQDLISFLMILSRHNCKYRFSKIRRRKRKINPATIG